MSYLYTCDLATTRDDGSGILFSLSCLTDMVATINAPGASIDVLSVLGKQVGTVLTAGIKPGVDSRVGVTVKLSIAIGKAGQAFYVVPAVAIIQARDIKDPRDDSRRLQIDSARLMYCLLTPLPQDESLGRLMPASPTTFAVKAAGVSTWPPKDDGAVADA